MDGKEELKTFPNSVKLIKKMAAAVAKAQEKNRVPEKPTGTVTLPFTGIQREQPR